MVIRPFFALATVALALVFTATSLRAADIEQVQMHIRQGQHDKALEITDALLVDDRSDPRLRFARGVALSALDRQDEAIAAFEGLIADFPELPEPYNNLAVLYVRQRQYEKARGALEMAIRAQPGYAMAHENLGDVYARLAARSYARAIELGGASATAKSKLERLREAAPLPAPGTKPSAGAQ